MCNWKLCRRDASVARHSSLLLTHDQATQAIAVSGVIRHNGKECPLLNLLIGAGWQTHLLRSDYSVVSKVGPKDSQEVLLTNYDPPRTAPIECCQASAEAIPA